MKKLIAVPILLLSIPFARADALHAIMPAPGIMWDPHVNSPCYQMTIGAAGTYPLQPGISGPVPVYVEWITNGGTGNWATEKAYVISFINHIPTWESNEIAAEVPVNPTSPPSMPNSGSGPFQYIDGFDSGAGGCDFTGSGLPALTNAMYMCLSTGNIAGYIASVCSVQAAGFAPSPVGPMIVVPRIGSTIVPFPGGAHPSDASLDNLTDFLTFELANCVGFAAGWSSPYIGPASGCASGFGEDSESSVTTSGGFNWLRASNGGIENWSWVDSSVTYYGYVAPIYHPTQGGYVTPQPYGSYWTTPCKTNGDCPAPSLSCDLTTGHCQAPTCHDRIQNGNELGVDLAGSCSNVLGGPCDVQADCGNVGNCIASTCTSFPAPPCTLGYCEDGTVGGCIQAQPCSTLADCNLSYSTTCTNLTSSYTACTSGFCVGQGFVQASPPQYNVASSATDVATLPNPVIGTDLLIIVAGNNSAETISGIVDSQLNTWVSGYGLHGIGTGVLTDAEAWYAIGASVGNTTATITWAGGFTGSTRRSFAIAEYGGGMTTFDDGFGNSGTAGALTFFATGLTTTHVGEIIVAPALLQGFFGSMVFGKANTTNFDTLHEVSNFISLGAPTATSYTIKGNLLNSADAWISFALGFY